MKKPRPSPLTRALSPLRDFLHAEASGGILLVGAAVVALIWANSPWQESYVRLWHSEAGIHIAGHSLTLDLQGWVNDGLMAIFFLVVGLEIKRELTQGHLSNRRAATLPVAAAIGGMVVPALLYLAIAGGTEPKGWGVPMATDIALAVGVLTLAGKHAPAGLRAYLLGLAVVDDIGAIAVIAIFYSSGVAFGWLAASVGGVIFTVIMQRVGVHKTLAYVVVGCGVWFALHEAGIHPTIAGVAMGLLAPITPRVAPDLVDEEELTDLSSVEHAQHSRQLARASVSTVEWLEHVLHPWSSFVIVPIFALANAGVVVSTESLRSAWSSPITWGILVGLVVGKPLGVLLASRVAVRTGTADRPENTTTRQLFGAGNAAGIGFTVALFIAELAFRDNGVINEEQVTDAKMAILIGSLVSGVLAFLVLRQRAAVSPADSTQSSHTH